MTDDYRMIVRATGGPEAIEREEITTPRPQEGEVVIRHTAIGLNFIDTYYRSGLYELSLPSGLGSEAAGVVEALGDGVTGLSVGQRVAYAGGPLGSYATVRSIPAGLLVPLPDAVGDRVAAAVMLKGLTADMLVGECGKTQPGQSVLVHAASGGVGSLLVAWLAATGVRVIAHASTPEKAQRATALGATVSLSCPLEELAAAVREATGGRGVDTVFDGVGKDSWEASLASLAKRGLMVSYGNASGPVPPIAPLVLARSGSLFLTRPTMFDYVDTPERLKAAAHRLFTMIGSGKVPVEIGQTFPLDHAADAHRALEERRTVGSTVLLP